MKKLKLISIFSILTFISQAQWTMIWNDEFDGTTLDNTKWTKDIGGWGFGNNESQYYTVISGFILLSIVGPLLE